MSKEINNSEYRKNAIKAMLKMLHEGKSQEEVKALFKQAFDSVSASEISQAEQALIDEGIPVEEVQRLCDIHSAVFKGSIAEIHQPAQYELPGHPVWVLKQENRAVEKAVRKKLLPTLERAEKDFSAEKPALLEALKELESIKIHYVKKENLLFPLMEKHGIYGPPKVMWSVDDEIRADIAAAYKAVEDDRPFSEIKAAVKKAADGISEMIFKEENIMIPMLLEALEESEWAKVAEEQHSLGFTMIAEPPRWEPKGTGEKPKKPVPASESPSNEKPGVITLPTGSFTVEELNGFLNALPVDITFVDKGGYVKYFSDNAERIFPRTKAVLGRDVRNCHPPASVHVVEQIINDFKSGEKNEESFWINLRGNFIYIRYFAVRSPEGEFLGTMEVTQNVTTVRSLTGEKRLLSK